MDMVGIDKLGRPQEFWEHFLQISKIPRCSGKEEQIRNYIVSYSNKLKLKHKIDDAGNLVVELPSENKKAVRCVLQAHLDMVCEKDDEIEHDFSSDTLSLKIEEIQGKKWLTAEGTTLGADNGVGIAYILTLMDKINSEELKFPNISFQFLFTVEEETGLVGALNIDKNLINGKYLINLDSEEADKFVVGCAGGITTMGEIPLTYKDEDNEKSASTSFILSIKGLKGGHSGTDIHKGRANAIKILSKILWKINNKYKISIYSLDGGNLSNAIPREAHAKFMSIYNLKDKIEAFCQKIISEIELGISKVEPNMQISLREVELDNNENLISDIITDKVFHLLYIMPNGPISYHSKDRDLVYTSTNLASIKTEEDKIIITTSQRSLHEISKRIMCEKIEALFRLADLKIDIIHSGNYPGWEPNFQSKILKIAKKTYQNLFNESTEVEVIHAGLECGILKHYFPETEMISIGPAVIGGHSPGERLFMPSVKKIWDFLVQFLNNLKEN
ncbi:MAG: beta-Ala-His dipeptidase [Candidatus Lokiarchaeota archaeon]|nr:beta-Ala-His dipeptidase [Candidatus Lokiarchaeota archaeon]MBD3340881.1 beta-Ala-His dipeptidase [Candidatus Lokiarchaeota archaeon]